VCGILILILGVVTLIRGKVSLTNNRVVTGGPAYIVGALFVLPFPLSFGVGVLMGMQRAAEGRPMDEQFRTQGTFVDLGLTIGCLIMAVIVAVCTAKRPDVDSRKSRLLEDDGFDRFDRSHSSDYLAPPNPSDLSDERFREGPNS